MKKGFAFLLMVFLLSACASPTPSSSTVAPALPTLGSGSVTTMAAPTATAEMPAAVETMPASAATQPAAMATMPASAATMPASSTQAAVPVTGAQTYTVLVGGEDMSRGADLMAFFPGTVHIHVGDTVHWKQNAMEIHTVTFLGGLQVPEFTIPVPNAPQGAMMFNPLAAFPAGAQDGTYDGTGVANSALMGMEQGQVQDYQLTFTKAGTYPYICVVHGSVMSGSVVVEDASAQVSSPADTTAQGQQEMTALMDKVAAAVSAAEAMVQPDVKNADGSTTHNVMVGYNDGQIDLMSFFPAKVNVKPGDTVVWTMGPKDMAPHTVTFLNGGEEPALVVPQPQGTGKPPFLVLNPAMALPAGMGKPLTSQGIFNSGLMVPGTPGPQSFTLKVGPGSGELDYICLLHDASGMKGSLVYTP